MSKKLLYFSPSQRIIAAILSVSLLFLYGFTVESNSSQSGSHAITDDDSILFIVRVDDILSRNQTYMPSSIRPLQEMAESRGAVVSWGVMPHRLLESNVNQGEMTRDLLATVANGHEVSLHGYIHLCQQCQHISGAPFWGHEMYCTHLNRALTYEQQEKLIVDGLKLLADSIGVRPTSFIPPGHASDATTHQVLVDYDFHALAIDKPHGFTKPELYNIGTSEDFAWELTATNYISRRTQALQDIRQRGPQEGLYSLLLHDPFSRPGYLNGLVIDWTAEVIDSVIAEFGSRIQFVTISEAATILSGTGTSADNNVHADENPITFSLRQNYPNPFNPVTTIPFTLDESQSITLRVYDVHGRMVRELVNGKLSMGDHSVIFDGAGLSSGVYVFTLTGSNGLHSSRSMVLLK